MVQKEPVGLHTVPGELETGFVRVDEDPGPRLVGAAEVEAGGQPDLVASIGA